MRSIDWNVTARMGRPFIKLYDEDRELQVFFVLDRSLSMFSSSDGIIYEVGYSPTGLGNYVYIKHITDDGTLFTAYGHMLDNSIIVNKNETIKKGQKIGQVGSTGASTGCHLHFMIMKNKISFKQEYLINPKFVIYGLK